MGIYLSTNYKNGADSYNPNNNWTRQSQDSQTCRKFFRCKHSKACSCLGHFPGMIRQINRRTIAICKNIISKETLSC